MNCPKCNTECSGMVHVGKTHFGTCQACKVAWWIGHNVFTVPGYIQSQAKENLHYLSTNFAHMELP